MMIKKILINQKELVSITVANALYCCCLDQQKEIISWLSSDWVLVVGEKGLGPSSVKIIILILFTFSIRQNTLSLPERVCTCSLIRSRIANRPISAVSSFQHVCASRDKTMNFFFFNF